jgi:hypothetical protein
MREAILPFPQYVFMSWYLFKHRDNFTFTFTFTFTFDITVILYLHKKNKENYYRIVLYSSDTEMLTASLWLVLGCVASSNSQFSWHSSVPQRSSAPTVGTPFFSLFKWLLLSVLNIKVLAHINL